MTAFLNACIHPLYNIAGSWPGLPVNRLVRKDPADTASGIWHVSLVARDYMDMPMRDGLAGGGAVVDADVPGCRGVFAGKLCFGLFQCSEYGAFFDGWGLFYWIPACAGMTAVGAARGNDGMG
jgi:hypothetical protein